MAAVVLGALPQVSHAGQTWQSADPLTISATPTVIYGQLLQEGQAQFYRFDVLQPTTLRLELGQPLAFPNFMPRVVLYQPDQMTLGPSLPMNQPIQTIALVYNGGLAQPNFDVYTQITYDRALNVPLVLQKTGTYYVAVYNAAANPGRYRLLIDHGQNDIASWADAWRLPADWWRDQSFAGWSWQTLLTPALLLVLAVLVVEQLRFYHLHHLAPSRSVHRPRKKTSPRKK